MRHLNDIETNDVLYTSDHESIFRVFSHVFGTFTIINNCYEI